MSFKEFQAKNKHIEQISIARKNGAYTVKMLGNFQDLVCQCPKFPSAKTLCHLAGLAGKVQIGGHYA